MYRLLVVDDEKIVLDSVSYMIKSAFENIMVETARNGKEGLQKLDSFKPHILMTDIRMPGITGLELIRTARQTDTTVKILIVTAFEEFEYAREAFKYSVEDYILKPLSKRKLVEATQKVLHKLESEQAKRDEELESIEKYYASINLVENNFFQSLMLNRDLAKGLRQYRDLLSLSLENGYMIALDIRNPLEDQPLEDVNNWSIRLSECGEYLKSHIKYHFDAIVSTVIFNRLYIYVEAFEGHSQEGIQGFWNNLHDTLLKRFGLKVKIAIGPVRSIENIHESYEESLMLLGVQGGNVIQWHQVTNGMVDPATFKTIEDEILQLFKERNRKMFDRLKELKEMYFNMVKGQQNPEVGENLLLELLVLIIDLCRSAGCKSAGSVGDSGYLQTYNAKPPIDKMVWFEEHIGQMFEEYSKLSERTYSQWVRSAIAHLESDFRTEVSLEAIAQDVGVTPQYLSKKFRQETGISFKEYLIDLRIQEAKQLLKQPGNSVREISYSIGYNDPNYFIRIFKKITGLTPGEYQRVIE